MAIIQISKLQQRSGNLVDLPQLSEAEFGWASDSKRLFIGKETPNENIEVLTSYSTIDFNQIEGSYGNLSISPTVADGELLVYNGSDWVNRGGAAGGLITLGDAANITIDGGAVNYVLTTDGLGNLTWTPKGALYTNIIGLSAANPIVMTVSNTTPYTNNTQVTISGVQGTSNNIVNGQTFYVQLAVDFPTSGNVSLYTSPGTGSPVNGTGLTYTNSPNAIATTALGSSGGGVVGGPTYALQYNDGSSFAGDANLVWNYTTRVLTVNGNASVGNLTTGALSASSQITSTVSTGTAPLVVASTTKVTNLNADLLDDYNTSVAAAATTVVVRDANANVLANSVQTNRIFNGTSNITITSSGNIDVYTAGNATSRFRFNSTGANVTGILAVTGNVTASNVYANTGTVGASLLTGTLTTAAQPNVTSVGTLTSLAVTGNVTSGNVYANSGTVGASLLTGTLTTAAQPNITSLGSLSSLTITGNVTSGNVYANSGTVGASLLTGTLTTAAQPNVTSVGTLTTLGVNGTVTAVNITANTGVFTGNGSALTNLNASNLSTGTVPSARLTGTYTIDISGSATTATTAGTVTTAAQPNITSVGTLSSLAVTGNITSANIVPSSYVIRSVATGISSAGTTQAGATLLSKDINIVSTVSGGQGVRLPVAVAGMVLIVNNTSATALNVYPSSGAAINLQATNIAYSHPAGASLQYYAVSATQWYTVGATYS